MPIFWLNKKLVFPPPHLADEEGCLAVGGDLSIPRLLLAYKSGIFPWYNHDEPIIWWCPDPRMVLLPNQIKVSKTMKQVLQRQIFDITLDLDFEQVIDACKYTKRKGQSDTWITRDMKNAYCNLHQLGYAHSVEVWNKQTNALVGGLYGISLGKCFFGESMFAHQSNASKAGFISLVQQLKKWQFLLIDCQVHTQHLESLGASLIDRTLFLQQLQIALQTPTRLGKWSFDDN